MATPSTPVSRLRQLIARQGQALVAPGVYDGLSTHIALSTHPEAIYVTGAGTSASRLGLPDLGFLSQDDMVAQVSMICSIARDTPVIADADVGFGGPAQVARTVERYARAGVSGLHIEDQVAQKRCGHLLGKQLASEEEFISRIRAADLGRKRSRQDIVVIARSDAIQGLGIDETVRRLRAAVEAGADVAFPEGMRSAEDVKALGKALSPTPLLLNLVAGGSTPDFTVQEAEALGVKLILFPANALKAGYEMVRTRGTDKHIAEGLTPRTFFELVGLNESLALDAQAGGISYAEGV